jgi:hypothetical protein
VHSRFSTFSARRALMPGVRGASVWMIGGLILAGAILLVARANGRGATSRQQITTTHQASIIAPTKRNTTYGALPSWLPQVSIPTGRVVSASSTHPWTAIEGDTVIAHLPHGTAAVTLTGPEIPVIGRVPTPKTERTRFLITVSHVRGAVPLRSQSLTVVDEHGHLHGVALTPIGPQHSDATSRPVSSSLSQFFVVLPAGDGAVRWAPEGGLPLITWDFVADYD